MFILKLGARRQINFNFQTPTFIKNLALFSKQNLRRVPDDDTLAYYYSRLNPSEFDDLRRLMINELVRKKCLVKERLFGYYLVAIDGTGHLVYKRRHCPYCLTKKKRGKVLYYYHQVVEAKLVTAHGFALSMATEFVENRKSGQKKQDCELKAFYRLVARLKHLYPQLSICLLLDALYANEQVIKICENNHWHYLITFKQGSLPETYAEYEALKKISKGNAAPYCYHEVPQFYYWMNDLNYKFKDQYRVNVLECRERNEKKQGKRWTRYLWLTNYRIGYENFHYLANQGGRLRWKEENEGFNSQKNGGYNLEHTYCYDSVAMKNFYLLLQLAHFISQLMEKGSLLRAIKKSLGSIRNIARRLLEELRCFIFTPEEATQAIAKRFQIRFDTS